MKLNLFTCAVLAFLCLTVTLAAKKKAKKVSKIADNYCDAELCPRGLKHVACNNTVETFTPSCPDNTSVPVNMVKYSRTITNLHNDLRNQLASGKLNDLPRAARMATMVWNDDLANLASYNARACDAKHDECHNTRKYRNSGQNLAVFNVTRNEDPTVWNKLFPEMIANSIRAWWNESSNATAALMQEYPKDKRGDQMRHFAVMAWENNTQVGCAAATYSTNQTSVFKMTCNYAVNYLPGATVYNFYSKGCQTGRNKSKNKNLCTPKEVF